MTTTRSRSPYRLSVAPMMERTDRHYRYMARLLTRRTLLYTEMVTTWALLHGDRRRLLDYSECERPLALQLGGDNPDDLAQCAVWAEELGYDEVNLNVGCPSERVISGRFGACLMAEPVRVAAIVAAMRARVRIPVTVKHRIGINGLESYEDLANFVRVVAEAGCARFTVHARIAILGGLSPAENREIPPLRYEDVYRLKSDFPALEIELNGGVRSLDSALSHLQHVDAVMIGRAAYERPILLASADALIFHDRGSSSDAPISCEPRSTMSGPTEPMSSGPMSSGPMSSDPMSNDPMSNDPVSHDPTSSHESSPTAAAGASEPAGTRRELFAQMMAYADAWDARGGRLAPVLKPMLTLFDGMPGARRYRRNLGELMAARVGGPVVPSMRAVVEHLSPDVLDSPLFGPGAQVVGGAFRQREDPHYPSSLTRSSKSVD
ncbi:MAG: tRNA dihydrouridine(20/20a) synthase DusA [Deltaproteobacteria bacterium]|nr:tRNA dihydrouridine(20/20a) synthase DusA [Deltaproteobacteria bacterium]